MRHMNHSRKASLLSRLTTALALVAMLGLGLSTILAQPVKAAPGAQAVQAAPAITGPFKQVAKTTLPNTSIDRPAVAGATTGRIRAAIAWAGTDAAHHLNVMLSGTGFDFYSKRTLSETAPYGPGIALTPDGKVAIAWAGTDGAHTLNVLYDVYGSPRKLTLWGETSPMAPALTYENGQLYLAWTGSNSGRSLNVQAITIGSAGLSAGAKTTLWSFASGAPPSLAPGPNHAGLILSWSQLGSQAIRFVTSANGSTWPATATTLPETTAGAPHMVSFVASNMPQSYLAWTGTNAAHSLNLQYTSSYPAWPASGTKSILDNMAFGGPQLAYIGGPQAILLVWTGIDTAHHLNVAVMTPSSTCTTPPGISPVSSQLIVYGNSTRKQVTLTFDAGGSDGVQSAKILDILARYNVKSTWFVEGIFAQDHRATIQRVVANGHEVGNHTVDHPDLVTPARSDQYICYQLGMAEQIIREVSGKTTRPFFRPPFGAYNSQVLNDAARLGYRSVYWSIDPIDWDPETSADQIVSRVLNSPNLKNGSIILMHAGSLHEPEALPRVIEGLRAKGYTIVPLSQLIAP